jgi:hypothetical protein
MDPTIDPQSQTTPYHVHNGIDSPFIDKSNLNQILPSQSGKSGDFLTTDGNNPSWAAINNVPSTLVSQMVCGENITAGMVVCVKPSPITYPVVQDSYVDQAIPNSNFGNLSTAYVGSTSSPSNLFKIAFMDFGLSPVPATNVIISAILNVHINTSSSSANQGPYIINVGAITSTWSEGTVTYNTKPTYSATNLGSFSIPQASLGTSYWQQLDITTDLQTLAGNMIYGFALDVNSTVYTNFNVQFDTKENGSTTAPYLTLTLVTTTDGKAYKADNSSFLTSQECVGIALASGTTNQSISVQTAGIVVGQSLASGATGGIGYLSTSGAITTTVSTTRIVEIGKILDANDFLLNIKDTEIFIQNNSGSGANLSIAAPVGARLARFSGAITQTNSSIAGDYFASAYMGQSYSFFLHNTGNNVSFSFGTTTTVTFAAQVGYSTSYSIDFYS